MTLDTNLALIEQDLDAAVRRLIATRRRRARTVHTTWAVFWLAAACTAVAAASGIAQDFGLDPTRWTILDRGEVDGGKAAYARATENATGRPSVFMVEHDAGLDRYQAFLLHERTVEAANTGETPAERGPLCTAAELTRAEVAALAALRSGGTTATATAAVRADFAGSECRGLAYAVERASAFVAGTEPESMLMPGAR